ncbi:general transcription factor II-I repeat domain-containing protein 2-like [Dicentrarchus labrax]|uniref:general transcription factor II-I repeat domain-containing protein 2-like n=1 Tax=Dicentrarchus labrax TaxID=13489 RepID=UPI0021F6924A|nr:general transcription factor II-I repeat domain-containing protein 2-like [Dicentrarchus labrax]
MSGGAGPSKKPKTYHFHTEWEEDFSFTMSYSKCVCLICKSTIAIPKKGNVERHFRTIHKSYNTDFPPKSELRRRKVKELKSQLSGHQAFFSQLTTKAKTTTEASFRVSHVLVKNKKSFQDGEMIKEAFVEAAESLFQDFKNKPEMVSSIKALQLSRSTVTCRCEAMAEDVTQKLWRDIADCECFSLQLDESTDVSDTAQLCIFIRMVFTDMIAKEELLTVLPMKEHTRGEDIFQSFKNFIKKTQLPVWKLVSITMDGAPAMIGRSNGFIAKCREDDAFPDFLNYHCIIHQQALCAKMLNMKEIMDVAMKIGCSIRGRSLQRRLFCVDLEKADCDHTELLLHTDVRWLSRGKFLQRFRELCPEIKEFLLASRHAEYTQLNEDQWLLDLAFLTDLTNMLNDLNVELQGKDKTVVNMISSVNVFKRKMQHLGSKLQRHDLANFQNLVSELERQGKACAQLDSGRYTVQIENLLSDFNKRFQDFALLEPVATFMCYPFRENADVDLLASEIATVFHLNSSGVEDEILTLQADIELKSRAHGQFWNLLTEEKYPNMRKCATSLTALFSSTYLCESAFSHMKIIKSKYRSTMTDHLEVCFSSYCPDYASLADSIQCKSSA